MASIFLSHNSKDKKFVRELANRLKNYGVKVWVDEAEIKIGDSLIKKIEQGIDEMEYIGVVLSPNSIDSEWVVKEVDMAMNMEIKGKRVKVLPLLYKQCNIPGFLIGKLYADFTSKKKFEDSFEKLLNTLNVDKTDNRRISGKHCIIEKDFRKKIVEYFNPNCVTVKYFEDLSGIDFIKVEIRNDIFTLYSHWTKPTHIELLNDIFKINEEKISEIEFLDEYVYLDEERETVFRNICEKFSFPLDSYPGQWPELNENGKTAWNEWINWIEERRVIALT